MRKDRPDSPIIGWYKNKKIYREGFGMIHIFDAPDPKYNEGEIITLQPWTDIKFKIVDIVYIIPDSGEIILEYTVKEDGEPHAREIYIKESEILPIPTKMTYNNVSR